MKCNYCGNEMPNNATFCPSCGMGVYTAQPSYTNIAAQPIAPVYQPVNQVYYSVLNMLKDKMLMPICILLTIATVAGFLSGSLPIIPLLLTIFMWTVSTKAKCDTVDVAGIRRISGTVFAVYVINWVCAGILVFASFCLFMAFGSMSNEIIEIFGESANHIPIERVGASMYIVIMVILIVVLFVLAVIVALFNIFGIRNIHKFTQSLYIGAGYNGYPPLKINAAKNWLMAFGVIQVASAILSFFGVSGYTSLFAFVSTGCNGVSLIMLSLLIRKYWCGFRY